MDPIAHARLALMAADDGDTAAAQAHLSDAQGLARATARRDRQVVEIAALVVAGRCERAAGLALVHTSEFPADADLLARVVTSSESGHPSARRSVTTASPSPLSFSRPAARPVATRSRSETGPCT